MPSDAQQPRDAIAAKIAELQAEERELVARRADDEAKGVISVPRVMSEDDKVVDSLARGMLDDHGSLLAEPEICIEPSVEQRLRAVRRSLDALSIADRQATSIEAEQKAIALAPEFKAIVKDWLAAAARWNEIEARAQAFRDVAGAGVMSVLTGSDLPIGTGSEIVTYRFSSIWQTVMTVEDVIALAVAAGLISPSDLARLNRNGGSA